MRYVFITLVLMGLSFGGGFWWEYSRTTGVRGRLHAANAELAQAQYTISLCRLQEQLLTLIEDTANKNYGDAAALSTKFFNDLSEEMPKTVEPKVKSAMQSILAQRDTVTGELAKGDPASHDSFVQMSDSFHHAVDAAAFDPALSVQ